MKVIFIKNVNRVGNVGDIKNVSRGYFRNFLQPRGFGVEATPNAIRTTERIQKEALRREAEAREIQGVLAKQIEAKPLRIQKKANEEGHLFGSVTTADIVLALDQQGFLIAGDSIVISEPIKALGTYTVSLHLGHDKEHVISLIVERE